MKQIISILTIIFLFGCNNKQGTFDNNDNIKTTDNSEKEQFDNGLDYKKVNQTYLDTLMIQICSTENIEIIDLYPILDTIASDKMEKLILVDKLKTKGFKVKDWGRGNWQDGPRIISFKMTDTHCECQIDKLYYSTENKDTLIVTTLIEVNACGQTIGDIEFSGDTLFLKTRQITVDVCASTMFEKFTYRIHNPDKKKYEVLSER